MRDIVMVILADTSCLIFGRTHRDLCRGGLPVGESCLDTGTGSVK